MEEAHRSAKAHSSAAKAELAHKTALFWVHPDTHESGEASLISARRLYDSFKHAGLPHAIFHESGEELRIAKDYLSSVDPDLDHRMTAVELSESDEFKRLRRFIDKNIHPASSVRIGFGSRDEAVALGLRIPAELRPRYKIILDQMHGRALSLLPFSIEASKIEFHFDTAGGDPTSLTCGKTGAGDELRLHQLLGRLSDKGPATIFITGGLSHMCQSELARYLSKHSDIKPILVTDASVRPRIAAEEGFVDRVASSDIDTPAKLKKWLKTRDVR